jgi:hypothetical protein
MHTANVNNQTEKSPVKSNNCILFLSHMHIYFTLMGIKLHSLEKFSYVRFV